MMILRLSLAALLCCYVLCLPTGFFQKIGDFVKSVGEGAMDKTASIADTLTHPIQSTKQLANSITIISNATLPEIGDGIKDMLTPSNTSQDATGKLVGSSIVGVATGVNPFLAAVSLADTIKTIANQTSAVAIKGEAVHKNETPTSCNTTATAKPTSTASNLPPGMVPISTTPAPSPVAQPIVMTSISNNSVADSSSVSVTSTMSGNMPHQ